LPFFETDDVELVRLLVVVVAADVINLAVAPDEETAAALDRGDERGGARAVTPDEETAATLDRADDRGGARRLKEPEVDTLVRACGGRDAFLGRGAFTVVKVALGPGVRRGGSPECDLRSWPECNESDVFFSEDL
jgi:hypothetical protein